MRIKLGNQFIDVIFVFSEDNRLRIQVEETSDPSVFLSEIEKQNTMVYMDDDDNVIQTFEGAFRLNCVEKSNGYMYYNLLLPTVSEKALQRVNEMEGDVTALRGDVSSQLVPLSIVFVQMAQDGTLDDVTISEHPALFPEWTENWTGKSGTILRDGDALYRSIHDITNVAQNTKPSKTPSMWTMVADPTEEYPMWVQPIGSHDAYMLGDKVSHTDKQWTSTVDNNVWEPGIYGWEEVTE